MNNINNKWNDLLLNSDNEKDACNIDEFALLFECFEDGDFLVNDSLISSLENNNNNI